MLAIPKEPSSGAVEEQTRPVSLEDVLGDKLAERLRATLASDVSEEIQKELSALLTVLTESFESLGPTALVRGRTAVEALLSDRTQLTFARQLRKKLSAEIRQRTAVVSLRAIFRPQHPATRVAVGLFVTSFVALICWIIVMVLHRAEAEAAGKMVVGFPQWVDHHIFALVVCFGALGSVVSIMVRLREFDRMVDVPPFTLFLIGLFKPVIGACFAAFSLCILGSGLVNPAEQRELSSALAIAFVAGFSERFGPDLVKKIEGQVISPTNSEDTPTNSEKALTTH